MYYVVIFFNIIIRNLVCQYPCPEVVDGTQNMFFSIINKFNG